MLDDLYIQDHYYSSVRDTHSEEDRYIVFRLQQSSRADKISFERRSLFWYKMGEISRVVFSIKMLFTGSFQPSSDGKSYAVSVVVGKCRRGRKEWGCSPSQICIFHTTVL